MSVNWTVSGDNLVFVAAGKSYRVARGDKNYNSVAKAIKEGKSVEDILSIFKVGGSVQEALKGLDRVTFDGASVRVDGEVLHDSIVQKVINIAKDGLPVAPILKFIDNVGQNPSFKSRKQLYDFLEHHEIALTDDGHFVAYKAVLNNYWDKYTGHTHLNTVGAVVRENRADIDDDSNSHCSKGLHLGAIQYVRSYGNGSTDRIMLVKVNPKNVVSVPNDYSCQKCRVCEYEVLGEVTDVLPTSLVTSDGKPYPVEYVEPEDFGGWDYEDEDDYEDSWVDDYEEDDDWDSEIDLDDDDYELPPQVDLS
jgi:hypothetical protein